MLRERIDLAPTPFTREGSQVRSLHRPPGSPRKASDGGAVSRNSGGSRGTLSLDAIAAAVIGGASLFGGRGRAMGVLLGAVLVASVGNGLDLLGLSGNFKSTFLA